MTTREAIEYLNNHYWVVGYEGNPPENECKKHNKVVDMAINALEKQTTKKITFGGNGHYYCPTCGYTALTETGDITCDYLLQYCNNCGQKFDWDD